MKFNKAEIGLLASQASHRFEKEGVLFVKERQEGFFKRNEISIERWCRLRGNLLFYFKSRDQWSEPAGVIVLEHLTVELDDSGTEQGTFGLILTFKPTTPGPPTPSQHLASYTSEERDSWRAAIQTASHAHMKKQLATLRMKVAEMQGNAEVPLPPASLETSLDPDNPPLLECSLACDNLLCDALGRPPSTRLLVFVLSNSGEWSKYSRTEIVEKTSNPTFLVTICFRSEHSIGPKTQVKILAQDLRERLTMTRTTLGQAVVSMEDLQAADRVRLRLESPNPAGRGAGFVTVNSWSVTRETACSTSSTPSHQVQPSTLTSTRHRRSQSLPPITHHRFQIPRHPNLLLLHSDPTLRTYRFHSGLGGDIAVMEVMAEPKLTFTFPQQLLTLWIAEEKELVHEIAGLGELRSPWHQAQMDWLENHLNLINIYSTALENLDNYRGPNFKRSALKSDPTYEFVPTNLHLQRMWVQNESLRKNGFYDIHTVGAFNAFAQKTKSQGLIKMLKELKSPQKDSSAWCSLSDKLQMAEDSLAAVRKVRREVVDCMRLLMKLAKERVGEGMFLIVEDMLKKTKLLCNISDTVLVEEALVFLEENKVTVRPEKDEFSESVAEFMQRNRLKIDLQFRVGGASLHTPCTEFISKELCTPDGGEGGDGWRGYSVFTSGYQSVDRLSDIDEFEESFKCMSVEDKTRHYYTLFRDVSPLESPLSTPSHATSDREVLPTQSIPENSPSRSLLLTPLPSLPETTNKSPSTSNTCSSPNELSSSESPEVNDIRTVSPLPFNQEIPYIQPSELVPLVGTSSCQSSPSGSPSKAESMSSTQKSPSSQNVSQENVSQNFSNKETVYLLPSPVSFGDDDQILRSEADSALESLIEEEEEHDGQEELEDDDDSTPHIGSETSKTQSPSSVGRESVKESLYAAPDVDSSIKDSDHCIAVTSSVPCADLVMPEDVENENKSSDWLLPDSKTKTGEDQISVTCDLVTATGTGQTAHVDQGLMSDNESTPHYRTVDEPEPIDLTHLNVEASMMCLASKVRSLCGRADSPTLSGRTFRFKELDNRKSGRNMLSCGPGRSDRKNNTDGNKEAGWEERNKGEHEDLEEGATFHIPDVQNPQDIVHDTSDWAGEVRPSMRKLRQGMDSLLKTSRLVCSVLRLQQLGQAVQLTHEVKHRRDVCFSQALTSLVSGLMSRLWCHTPDPLFLQVLTTIGPLICFEGLLSMHGEDVTIINDMIVAVEDLRSVEFTLVLVENKQKMPGGASRGKPETVSIFPLPRVTGSRTSLRVMLPVPDWVYTLLPIQQVKTMTFTITPVFLNIGINEQATIADRLGMNGPQEKNNSDNLKILQDYVRRYKKGNFFASRLQGGINRHAANNDEAHIDDLLSILKNEVGNKKNKNVDVLSLSSQICTKLNGLRFTSCKSGKDRTGMSATLEQVNILCREFDLSDSEYQRALDTVRSEGTRRVNCAKNIDKEKYAFNTLQLATFPRQYRPPVGTYGSSHT